MVAAAGMNIQLGRQRRANIALAAHFFDLAHGLGANLAQTGPLVAQGGVAGLARKRLEKPGEDAGKVAAPGMQVFPGLFGGAGTNTSEERRRGEREGRRGRIWGTP